MLRKGLASHTLSIAESSGSLAMAPWGRGLVSSPVVTLGFVSQGRLAPGTVVMGPILLLSHSDHILKNGSKDFTEPPIEAPTVPPPSPPGSVIFAPPQWLKRTCVLPLTY